jgi:general secretion pathway protein C
LKDYGVIVERNIFNHEAKPNAAALEQSNRPNATPARSAYVLLGTVVAEPDSLALVHLDDGNDIFRLGEQLPDGAVIEGVDRNRIILRELNGTQHQLTVENLSPHALSAPEGPSSTGIREIGRNRWRINRDEVEKARSDLNSLLKSARMEPKIENGRTEGVVVKMIQPKSLLDRLGLKRNDLVREVNGVPLNSPETALQIFQQLREAKRIVIGLERRNKPISLEYTIE